MRVSFLGFLRAFLNVYAGVVLYGWVHRKVTWRLLDLCLSHVQSRVI